MTSRRLAAALKRSARTGGSSAATKSPTSTAKFLDFPPSSLRSSSASWAIEAKGFSSCCSSSAPSTASPTGATVAETTTSANTSATSTTLTSTATTTATATKTLALNLNRTLAQLGRSLAWQNAVAALQAAPAGHADVVSYNSCISACGKAAEWRVAVALLEDMYWKSGLQGDLATMGALLQGCRRKSDGWILALSLLEAVGHPESAQVAKSGPLARLPKSLDERAWTALIATCGRASRWVEGLLLCARAQKHRFLGEGLTAILSATAGACVSANAWQRGLTLLLGDARRQRLHLDSPARGTVLQACATGACWPLALSIIRGDLKPSTTAARETKAAQATTATTTTTTTTSATSATSTTATTPTTQATEPTPPLPPLPLSCSAAEVNIAMAACAHASMWMEVLRLLDDSSLVRDLVTFNTTLGALNKAMQWSSALDLFSNFSALRVSPDALSLSAVATSCSRGTHWEGAVALMRRRRPTPNRFALSAALGACASATAWEQALAMIEWQEVRPDLDCYNTLLHAFAVRLAWRSSVALLTEGMPAHQIRPDALTFDMLRRVSEGAGRITGFVAKRAVEEQLKCVCGQLEGGGGGGGGAGLSKGRTLVGIHGISLVESRLRGVGFEQNSHAGRLFAATTKEIAQLLLATSADSRSRSILVKSISLGDGLYSLGPWATETTLESFELASNSIANRPCEGG